MKRHSTAGPDIISLLIIIFLHSDILLRYMNICILLSSVLEMLQEKRRYIYIYIHIEILDSKSEA
jgi:hypothetical protein